MAHRRASWRGWRQAAITSAVGVAIAMLWLGEALASQRTGALARVERWGYQLERATVTRLAASPHDLLVIDPSRDQGEGDNFTSAEIEHIKRRPGGGTRLVLAYVSIGEAEVYRDYWRWYWGGRWYSRPLGWLFAPAWLGSENSQWRGNFAVRYWEKDCQQRFISDGGLIEKLVAAGFDGVYLDKVDSSVERIAKGRPTARDDMRTFVRRIAEKGRAAKPGFLIVPQNGEELLEDDAYIDLIDGIAKEDLLYGEFREKQPNPAKAIARRSRLLMRARDRGKTVLAVEYLDNANRIEDARGRLEDMGFVPYFADRRLRTLRYGDGPETARR